MADRSDQTDASSPPARETNPEAVWRTLAERALGTSAAALTGRTVEGLPIPALTPRRRDDPSQPWRAGTKWSISQRVDHPDPQAANRLVLDDLGGGVDALLLVGAQSPFARGFGLAADIVSLDQVLGDVELDFIRVALDAGPDTPAFVRALAEISAQRRLTSAALDIDLGWDPIGCAARTGTPLSDELPRLLRLRRDAGFAGPVFRADTRPWHEAGAGEALELAAAVATGVAYLRRLEAAGVDLAEAVDLVGFMLAADADVFLGIAKLRAMRRLWARVIEAAGLAAVPARLHVETSWRMMTRRDPWTNAMRATAAAFAAGIGGADVCTVLPFTLPLGLPDEGARRLARNLQHVLIEEAHLAAVEDPAAGAGGFEALTETLCAEAWSRFQAIEQDGGIERAMPRLADEAAATAKTRAGDLAHQRRAIIGTSGFARLDLPETTVLDVEPRPTNESSAASLPERLDAAGFEALRDRAEASAAAGTRPHVFLATLGKASSFGPRASEAVNFFAAGGITAEAALDERDVDGLATAFKASGANVACLCGSDADYATLAAPVTQALRTAGASLILSVDGGQADVSGIDATIGRGFDLLAALSTVLDHA